MTPLRLRMRAFGPFLHQQTVDFTCLDAHRLFLI